MAEKHSERLWSSLQGKKPHFPDFLTEIRLHNIRGVQDLNIRFEYPVSVIAGENASGKTTALLAAACAYQDPRGKGFTPATLFPDYRPSVGERKDEKTKVELDCTYSTPQGLYSMRWKRGAAWSRSFFGRKKGLQPERPVYLRTLSNLTNPSEVRGVLGMLRVKKLPKETILTASQIDFAHQLLDIRYSEVVDLAGGKDKNLLFASQTTGAAYSELHMAAGERAVLRLAQQIAQLEGALVLIDEVEAGLHPWVQELLMRQLQNLALRNNLQIIVTTHSPVVLESVPFQGRIFLGRNKVGKVEVLPPYRDIVQNALYRRSSEALNLLCEDEVAESILQGVLDHLSPKEDIKRDAVRIGRDTGASEFPTHASAFKKFQQIRNFVFVLDGDQSDGDIAERIRAAGGADVPVLHLPGRAPEIWIWDMLGEESTQAEIANKLGISQGDLRQELQKNNQLYDKASDTPSNISKHKLDSLARSLRREVPSICRVVGRLESSRKDSDLQPLAEKLTNIFFAWRENKG